MKTLPVLMKELEDSEDDLAKLVLLAIPKVGLEIALASGLCAALSILKEYRKLAEDCIMKHIDEGSQN